MMKKRLFWASLALFVFILYSVAEIACADYLFTTHSFRIAVISSFAKAVPFGALTALIALEKRIKLRVKKLLPTMVLCLFLISFIVVKFGILGEYLSFIPFISLENGVLAMALIFAVAALIIKGNAFKIYFLTNLVFAIFGAVIGAALCDPTFLGSAAYGIASYVLFGISCDPDEMSEEETLLKFEENVRRMKV